MTSLQTESPMLLQFVPESGLSLIEQSLSLHKQQSNREKKIDGSRGMEKRDSIDLSAIDRWGSLHCALRVKCTLSANWWGWIWKGVKWLEDTEVEDETGGSQRWQGRKSRLEKERGHEVSNRRKPGDKRFDKRGWCYTHDTSTMQGWVSIVFR